MAEDTTQLLTAQDIKSRWIDALGPIPASDDQLSTLVAEAEGLMLDEFPDIPARIDKGTLKKRTVVRVGSRMVLRLLNNPDGSRTVQESAGEFSQSRTAAGDTLGEIYMSAHDRAELEDRTPTEREDPRAFTLLPRGA